MFYPSLCSSHPLDLRLFQFLHSAKSQLTSVLYVSVWVSLSDFLCLSLIAPLYLVFFYASVSESILPMYLWVSSPPSLVPTPHLKCLCRTLNTRLSLDFTLKAAASPKKLRQSSSRELASRFCPLERALSLLWAEVRMEAGAGLRQRREITWFEHEGMRVFQGHS